MGVSSIVLIEASLFVIDVTTSASKLILITNELKSDCAFRYFGRRFFY